MHFNAIFQNQVAFPVLLIHLNQKEKPNFAPMKSLLQVLLILYSFTLNAQSAEDYYKKGNDKAMLKDYSGAIEEYTKSIDLNPRAADSYYNRGLAFLYQESYKKANDDFTKAIEIRPGFIKALNNRAVSFLRLDNTTSALADINTMLSLDSMYRPAYFLRAQVYLQLDNKDAACKDLTVASEMGEKRAEKLLQENCNTSITKESLQLEWPESEGWKIANKTDYPEKEIIELLRNNETFENWKEIGTMMKYKNLPSAPLELMMNAMHNQAKKNCPDATLTLIEKDENANYPYILFKIECNSNNPESQVWQMIKGKKDQYINFRAVKRKEIPSDVQTKWVTFFKTARIISE